MLQDIVDLLFVVMMLGFLWLVLKELAQSQKVKDTLTPPSQYMLIIQLKTESDKPAQTLEYLHDDVNALQFVLNSFSLFRIYRCKVVRGDKVTHVMSSKGVLEVV